MSKSYWMKPAKDTYAPSSFICVIVGTKEKIVPGKIRISESTFDHVCVVACKRRKGKWSSPLYRLFTNTDDFWEWLHSYGSRGKCTYVYSPIASNSLTLLQFWNLIDALGAELTREDRESANPIAEPDSGGGSTIGGIDPASFAVPPTNGLDPKFKVSNYIVTGKVDILKYRIGGRSFAWASSKQYIDIDESILADALNFKWTSSLYSDESQVEATHNAKDRCFLWAKFHRTLIDWWLQIDGGPWGMTLSQMSYSFWRKRIPPKSLLVHADSEASYVEECSAFGGRASVWCLAPIGDVEKWQELYVDCPPTKGYPPLQGPIAHLDVCSMYPSLLAEREYPVQLIGTYPGMRVDALKDALGELGAIATVVLNCKVGEYPYRSGERVVYPIGRFCTTLAGPELQAAIQDGEIEEVQHVNLYRLGRPYQEAAAQLLQHRRETQEYEKRAWELLVKQMSNALSGKLAQRKDKWIPRPGVIPPNPWGHWYTVDYETRTSNEYRCIAGMALERVPASSAPRVLLSGYAYLTGYGRQLMRVLRKVCQPSLVVSQDTDGLWLLLREDALDILERSNKAAAPISVRLSGNGNSGVWLSPVHYWIDGHWTLAGFRIVTVASSTLRVVAERTSNPITMGTDRPPSNVRVIRETRELTCERIDGIVGSDGWITPSVMSLDRT